MSESGEIESQILDYIRRNPLASQTKTAKAINKNEKTVKASFARLKANGKIEWLGQNNKNVQWIVKDA